MMPRSHITNGPRGMELLVPPLKGESRFLVVVFSAWMLVILCFFAFAFRHAPVEVRSILYSIAVVTWLVMCGFCWLQDLSKAPTRICLEPECIVVTSKRFGFNRTRTMNSRFVSNLRAHYLHNGGEFADSIVPGIAINYRGREHRLICDISEEEAGYLVNEIKKYYQNLNISLTG